MDNRIQENLNNKNMGYCAPFLWLHGVSPERLVREIDHIKESGFDSVCLESRTYENFLGDSWWRDIEIVFSHCREIGMKVWILDDKHFPSGYANGSYEEKYKDLKLWGIAQGHIDVAGPVTDGSAMADIWLEEPEEEIIAAAALRHIPNSEGFDKVIPLELNVKGGMLYFNLPEGMWRIVFMKKTRNGVEDWAKAYCDMLNPESTEVIIKEVYQPHYDRFAEYFGGTFLGFFSDEPSFLNNSEYTFDVELGDFTAHYPWSDCIKDKFSTEELCALWFDIEGVSEKARCRFMDVITREYARNYCDKLGTWCREHGVMYIGHVIEDNNAHIKTGRGTGHYFRALWGQDMSGVDVVLHQIVPGLTECNSAGLVCYNHMNSEFFHYTLGKLGSSLAHIDAKKHGRALCEIFGAYGWAEGTEIMKYLCDHMLVRGINYFVPHAFSEKEKDTDCPPNFRDCGQNPQYRYFKYIANYLNRMSHMLSGGTHISDCAILYNAEIYWADKASYPLEKIGKELYDNMIDYDIIPLDVLSLIDNDGKINNEEYKLIIVPYSDKMPTDVTDKLKEVNARVIMTGNIMPDKAYGFEFIEIKELSDYLKNCGYSHVKSDYDGIYLRFYHYRRGGADIYMFSNEDSNNEISAKITLPEIEGEKYIEYDAFLNTAVIKYSMDNTFDLKLAPYNSRIIITGNADFSGIREYKEKTVADTEELNLKFDISIAENNSDNFDEYKTKSELFNITGADGLPYFSGRIKYETEFDVNKDIGCVIDLGNVGEIAEVYLNGKFIGEKLYPPYSFDITESIKQGKNKLTVIVANHKGYEERDRFSKYLMFKPSGLLGPIKLNFIK